MNQRPNKTLFFNFAGIKTYLLVLLLTLPFISCVKEEEFDNTPEGNFEALWQMMDRNYCFFEYKDVDWNEIHDTYRKRITPGMSNEGLFQVLGDMLSELQDGHVNLSSAYNVARYWKWFEDYPKNFSDSIQRVYLGTDYKIASGLKYKILDDNIGYIYYESFSDGIGEGNLDEVLFNLAVCDGIIIDIRNNGGGNMSNATKIASRFTNEKVLTGYVRHKVGSGHSDFSDPKAIYLEPSDRIRWQKKVAVLTNRSTFSAANDFASIIRFVIPKKATIIGDKTGGGSGFPFSSELPNGWGVRFSSSPFYDATMNQTENGIDPDIKVNMSSGDMMRKRDTIIETARSFLKGNLQ